LWGNLWGLHGHPVNFRVLWLAARRVQCP